MTTQRTPKRLIPLVRFLESKLADPRGSERVKMQAADRLTSIYLQIEQTKERTEVQRARAEARAREAEAGQTGQAEPPKAESVESFLASIRREN